MSNIKYTLLFAYLAIVVIFSGCTQPSLERGILSGEVTWTDDTDGQTYPDADTDVLVFPFSASEFFRNSIKLDEEHQTEYIESEDVAENYRFVNTNFSGNYLFELDFGSYLICFGSKVPNEAEFERFYPTGCYKFGIDKSEIIIDYGGDRLRSVDCKNTVCEEFELLAVEASYE